MKSVKVTDLTLGEEIVLGQGEGYWKTYNKYTVTSIKALNSETVEVGLKSGSFSSSTMVWKLSKDTRVKLWKEHQVEEGYRDLTGLLLALNNANSKIMRDEEGNSNTLKLAQAANLIQEVVADFKEREEKTI